VPLKIDGLSIVPRVEGDTMQIAMSGVVEMRDPGQTLNPYWTLIDEEARRRRLKFVDLNVRELSFMNSSGILTLVRWIMRCKTATDGYRIRLHYDRSLTWQRASITTLAKLAPNVVTLMEIDG